MALLRFVNWRGDLFATISSFGVQATIRFGSSLILTRLLIPEEYGIMTVLMAVIYVMQMIGDLGINFFIVRDQRAEEPRYRNTAWTIGLARALLNFVVLLLVAPLIARLYQQPVLTAPLRVIAFMFLLMALQSMSFPLAIRLKRSRIIMYSDMVVAFLTAIFTVVYTWFSRDFWGMVMGTLFGTALGTAISYGFYPQFRPRLAFDREAAREIFQLSKFTTPSSLLTLLSAQFDKAIFLRLFNLQLLGVYGLANNLANALQDVVSRISQMVFYPRVAHRFRENRNLVASLLYRENVKLFATLLICPALVIGAARLIVRILYPAKYAEAGPVLEALMVRVILQAFANPAEDLLIAAGESRVIFLGSACRTLGTVAGSLIGYWLYGFIGFVYGLALSALLPLIYYFYLQGRRHLVVPIYEFYKLAFVALIAVCAHYGSTLLMLLVPVVRLKFS